MMDRYIVFEAALLLGTSIAFFIATLVCMKRAAVGAAYALLDYDRHDNVLSLIEEVSWPALTAAIGTLSFYLAMEMFPKTELHGLIFGV